MGWIIALFGALFSISKLKSKAEPVVASKVSYTAESWRNIVEQFAGDIPVDFILTWIKVESSGNPCATGGALSSDGSVKETGLFQFYYPDDYAKLGININDIRAYCFGGKGNTSNICVRKLTLEEMNYQIRAGIHYIQLAMAKARKDLNTAGCIWETWNGKDFWKVVKLQHTLPTLSNPGLKNAAKVLGHPPKNWKEFRDITLLTPALWGRYNRARMINIFDNAEKVGAAA